MATKRKSSSATESAPKREKKVKTLQEKVELLDMLQRVKSSSAVARHYSINESTVTYIKKNEKQIREAVAAAAPAGAKRLHVVRDANLSRTEAGIFLRVQDCHKKRIPIDSVMIRGKAKSLYENLKSREGGTSQSTDFLASKGWVDKFRHRYGLRNVRVTGEAASANQEAAREFPATFKQLIEEKGYEPEQAFNADETALFWKKMPQRTFISKEDKRAPGFKAARDRLTMLLCANAVGHIIKPTLIYKAANPRALKGKDKSQLPVYWMSNKKAWTTRALFLEWFHQCFVPEVRKYLANKGMEFKVMLALDNAPGHPDSHEFHIEGVEIVYLPPNTTSIIQPLDQGVIRTFKAHYTRYSLERIVHAMDEGHNVENIMKNWKEFTIADAIKIIERAVKAVKPETVNLCWKNIWPECVKRDINVNITEPGQEIMEGIIDLAKQVGGEGFEDMHMEDIQDLIDTRSNELTEDDLIDLTAPEGEAIPDDEEEGGVEEEVPEDKFTLDNIAESIHRFNGAIDFFYDIDPSMVRALKVRELEEAAIST
uniref:Tigger transposable element-derived protein 1-like n=1 Tax=Geotrypetes seraphini TaxID=260995 RepID=A0A6P8S781_GEOSA|nr:tigger transposable element-derived protein 1-like [Geotrypetes seraphini]